MESRFKTGYQQHPYYMYYNTCSMGCELKPSVVHFLLLPHCHHAAWSTLAIYLCGKKSLKADNFIFSTCDVFFIYYDTSWSSVSHIHYKTVSMLKYSCKACASISNY